MPRSRLNALGSLDHQRPFIAAVNGVPGERECIFLEKVH